MSFYILHSNWWITDSQNLTCYDQDWALLNQFLSFINFICFLVLMKHRVPFSYHVHTWQVSRSIAAVTPVNYERDSEDLIYSFVKSELSLAQKLMNKSLLAPAVGGPEEDIQLHDVVIKWKHFPRYWPFVRGIHRSPVNSPHKGSDAELWCFLWSVPE